MRTPLDYKHPTTRQGTARRTTFTYLRDRHRVTLGASLVGAIIGAAILLVVGAAIAGFVMAVLYRLTGSTGGPFWAWMCVYLLVLVPFLIAYAKRTGGSVYGDMVIGSGMHTGKASSYGEWEMRQSHASLAMWAEIILWGPKTLVESIRELMGADASAGQEAKLLRASEIIDALLAADEAVPVSSLQKPGEDPRTFLRTLRWLDQQGHIGLSSDRKRAWASSELKQRMKE